MTDETTAGVPDPPLIETTVSSKDVVPSASQDEVRQAIGVLEQQFKSELNAIRRHRKKVDARREAAEKTASEVESFHQKVAEAATSAAEMRMRCEESAKKAHESADSAASAQAQAVAAEQVAKASRAIVEEKQQFIEKAAELAQAAEKQAEEIKKSHALVQQNRAAVERAKSTCDTSLTAAKAALSTIQNVKSEAEAAKAEVVKLQGEVAKLEAEVKKSDAEAKKASGDTVALVERLKTAESDIDTYKAKLAAFESAYQEIRSRIESLLPGATSAGLAQAFENRSGGFGNSLKLWNAVFILSILALVFVGISFKDAVSEASLDLGHALTVSLFRLPIALPLIWLALHSAGRTSGIRRIEEDYAYKAVMSRSFEGYRRQMEQVGGDDENAPIRKLCADLLHMLSLPPGRLHDARYQEATPLAAVSDSVRSLRKGLRAKVKTPVGSVEIEDDSSEKGEPS